MPSVSEEQRLIIHNILHVFGPGVMVVKNGLETPAVLKRRDDCEACMENMAQ